MNTNELSRANTLVILNDTDVPVTTSLKVAEKFGKEHYDVLDSIKNIIETLKTPDNPIDRNFPGKERDTQVGFGIRKDPYFDMDRKGFMLLVMGFTGTKAMKFKNDFVDAFNAMEKKLIEPEPFEIPKTFAEALMLAGKQAEKIELQETVLADNAPKVEVYDTIMSEEGLVDMKTGFKNIGLHPNHMMAWCRDNGYLYYGNVGGSDKTINLPFTMYIVQGLFEIISIPQKNRNAYNKQTMLTPKGTDYFTKKKLNGEIPEWVVMTVRS